MQCNTLHYITLQIQYIQYNMIQYNIILAMQYTIQYNTNTLKYITTYNTRQYNTIQCHTLQ